LSDKKKFEINSKKKWSLFNKRAELIKTKQNLYSWLEFYTKNLERPEFVKPLIEQMPYYALRHLTRPGLTGWAQVKYLTPVANLEDNLTKLQYDLYYIKHRSFALDFSILLKTVGIVLRRQGT
jgi:hypothetical protein